MVLERKVGGGETRNPLHKGGEIPFHLGVGEHLYYSEDRCSAEKMAEVAEAPGLY